MVFLLLSWVFSCQEGVCVALFLGAFGPSHGGACNKMMNQDHCPVSLGQLEMEGPHTSLVLGQAGGVMVAEADPPNPTPQEGTGESSVLKHGHGNAYSCSPVQLLGMRNLGWELRASWKIWRSLETP